MSQKMNARCTRLPLLDNQVGHQQHIILTTGAGAGAPTAESPILSWGGGGCRKYSATPTPRRMILYQQRKQI